MSGLPEGIRRVYSDADGLLMDQQNLPVGWTSNGIDRFVAIVETDPVTGGITNLVAGGRDVVADLGLNSSGSIYYTTPEKHGAVHNGVTNDFTAVQAAINELAEISAGKGGEILFDAEIYLIIGQLVIPHTTDTPPRQVPITLRGLGGYCSGQGSPLSDNKGTILDMRSDAVDGKIVTYGLGILTIEKLTMTDLGGATNNPFVYTTNTTLHIRKTAFLGSKSGLLCDQDAIVCGGNGAVHDDTPTAPFQGYGTVIENNFFNGIRRAVYGRKYFNANVIANNTVWNACGSNLVGGAAFELDGHTPNYCVGNMLSGNLIEMGNYPYAIKLTTCSRTTVIGNGCYDDSVNVVGCIYLAADSTDNIIIGSAALPGKPYVTDLGPRNTFLCADSTESTKLSSLSVTGTANFSGSAFFTNKEAPPTIQASAAGLAGGTAWNVLRSAAEGVNPGGVIYKLTGIGSQEFGGSGSGNVTGDYVTYANNGRAWRANGAATPSGGNMEINSGSGGSYLDMYHYAVRYRSHAGTLLATFGAALGGFLYEDGVNDAYGTVTGTKLGTAANQKLALWGATPDVQPANASQAAVAGSAGGTYTSTEQGLINSAVTLVNQLRADLVRVGIIKGAA